ncbi:MAG: hypothetical protein AAB691_04270 [Patescibacteria group bacterium]
MGRWFVAHRNRYSEYTPIRIESIPERLRIFLVRHGMDLSKIRTIRDLMTLDNGRVGVRRWPNQGRVLRINCQYLKLVRKPTKKLTTLIQNSLRVRQPKKKIT